jgi:predicted xylose isomerase-like sugar epimerase
MVLYAPDGLPDGVAQIIATRNAQADLHDLVGQSWSHTRELCEHYVAVGFSKLVLVPLVEPRSWDTELAKASAVVANLQT